MRAKTGFVVVSANALPPRSRLGEGAGPDLTVVTSRLLSHHFRALKIYRNLHIDERSTASDYTLNNDETMSIRRIRLSNYQLLSLVHEATVCRTIRVQSNGKPKPVHRLQTETLEISPFVWINKHPAPHRLKCEYRCLCTLDPAKSREGIGTSRPGINAMTRIHYVCIYDYVEPACLQTT